MIKTINVIALWRLVGLAATLLASQGVVRLLQAVCGLLLVHWLSVEAFAVFTIAMALLSVVRIGADFGLTHALVVFAASQREQADRLGSLFSTGRRQAMQLLLMTAPVVGALAIFTGQANEWPMTNTIAILALVLVIGWTQIYGTLGSAILNALQDVRGLFNFGIAETGVRLVATLGCLWWPHPGLALFAIWLGAIAGRFVIGKRLARRVNRSVPSTREDTQALRAFIWPLVPGIVYFVVQGQISVFMLGVFGNTQAVAEVGALSRLGQIISLIGVLNPFIIQPHFARIKSQSVFIQRSCLLFALMLILLSGMMISTYLVPELWLFILGENYIDLTNELPLLMLCAVASLVSGTLYSIAISRGVTTRQSWAIVPGLLGQIAFIALNGVSTTTDALLLNLIPAVGYVLAQAVLVSETIIKWHHQTQYVNNP